MKEKMESLLQEGREQILSAKTEAELQNIKAALLGKKGKLTELMKELPDSDALSSVFWGDVLSAVTGLPFLFRETEFTASVLGSLLIFVGLFIHTSDFIFQLFLGIGCHFQFVGGKLQIGGGFFQIFVSEYKIISVNYYKISL